MLGLLRKLTSTIKAERLCIAIGLSGWVLMVSYLAYEYFLYGGFLISHLIATRDFALPFHIMIFLAPVLSTAFAYAVSRGKAAEKRYRGLIEGSADAIISANETGEITQWNDAATGLFAYTREEAVGSPFHIIIPEKYRKRHFQAFKRYLEEGEDRVMGTRMELEALRKDGTIFPVEFSLSAQKIEGSNLFTIIVRDITRRKRMEENLKFHHEELKKAYGELEALFNLDKVMSQSLDLEEVLNSALEGVLKQLKVEAGGVYLLEDDSGTLLLQVSEGFSDGFVEEGLRIKPGEGISGLSAEEGEPVALDAAQHPGGRLAPAVAKEGLKATASTPIMRKGRMTGEIILATREERTFDKNELDLLASMGSQLGNFVENARLYEELQQAYYDLKGLDDLKRNIVGNVTHELRTPITIVRGALELLRDEKYPERRDKLLDSARDALERQDLIVGDLIETSRMELDRGKPELAPLDIARLIKEISREFKLLAKKHRISLKHFIEGEIPRVEGDKRKIRHVLRNLLNNAIKFNTEGGRVTIEARGKDGMAEVCVSDTGIGIAREVQEKIFESLYQVDGTVTRRYGGTGMGLAIAKEIVEAHGGDIWAESEGKDKGSTFCFTLPVER